MGSRTLTPRKDFNPHGAPISAAGKEHVRGHSSVERMVNDGSYSGYSRTA